MLVMQHSQVATVRRVEDEQPVKMQSVGTMELLLTIYASPGSLDELLDATDTTSLGALALWVKDDGEWGWLGDYIMARLSSRYLALVPMRDGVH